MPNMGSLSRKAAFSIFNPSGEWFVRHVNKIKGVNKMKTSNEVQTITGSFQFFTCKTGRGRDRYCVKVNGTIVADDGKSYPVTVQAFEDWDGRLPASLAAIIGNTYTDPETGLHRSVKGALKGSVKVPADTPIAEVPGNVVTFYQCDAPIDAFTCEKTATKFVEFK